MLYASGAMAQAATLQLRQTTPVKISQRLYGHFAEHLGRCCYDGLWVGLDSPIPNRGGFRSDVVDLLTEMPTPLLRWPGGCYADHYHWRDGIGPSASRAVRLGLSCGRRVQDDNTLGTHEFLDLCRQLGAEPYLAGNMGSGSVQELCDWVEYCNSEVPTTLARERAANGSPDPFGVRLWGVGNENWGCGGEYDAQSYGLEYRRYASMIRHVDPSVELVICGHDAGWNRALAPVLKGLPHLIDHWSIHRYWISGGLGASFTEAQFHASIKEAHETEQFILETREILDQIDPDRRIGIALDEWGTWHADSRTWGPDAVGDVSQEYFQISTQRDAVQTAVALEVFHRQAEILSMANLAQIVNVLHAPIQTEGEAIWTTPTYHVLKMHRSHIGQKRVEFDLNSPFPLPDGSSALSATVTHGERGTCATVTNRSFDSPAQLQLPDWAKSVQMLSAPPHAANSAAHPDQVKTVSLPVAPILEIPPATIVTLGS